MRSDVSMVFYGQDLCVAYKHHVSKYHSGEGIKEEYGSCKSFCIPFHHGIYRAVVSDNMVYKKENVTLERVIYKYHTL